VRWLYFELVAMSDFKTGLVYTSYARLASLLDCDQPERGKRLDTPTIKQIRTALDTLARMNLALRDRTANEEKRELKILVAPRVGLGASNEKKGRVKGRPQNGYNYDEHGPSRKPDTQIGQRAGQGVQDGNSLLPPPLHVHKLSTVEGPENTSHQGPPRGPTHAPSGHAPRLTELGHDWRIGDQVDTTDPSTWPRDELGRLVAPAWHPIHRQRYRDP
jgi:hypothetical protein